MITVTESAKTRILEIIKEENHPDNSFLRVGVKGGGCGGLQYVLKFDTVQQLDDQSFEDKGVKIVTDKRSLLYIFGTELDYTKGLNGKGFEFNNPQGKNCSCGSSFRI